MFIYTFDLVKTFSGFDVYFVVNCIKLKTEEKKRETVISLKSILEP